MKVKAYEKKLMIKILLIGIIMLELTFFWILYIHKEFNYKKIDGIVVTNNAMALVLSKEERNVLYKNGYLLIDDRLRKYTILEDNGVFIKKGNKKYYEVIIKTKIDKKYKVNDSLEINLKDKKYRMIEMFKLIWGGE